MAVDSLLFAFVRDGEAGFDVGVCGDVRIEA
jgi:hypothetical protein